MILQLSSELVWKNLKQELFAVMGMVTDKGEARTVGVVYAVHNQKLYIVSGKDTWKVHHVSRHPNVSITVPIAKRLPLLYWIKIPAATITFSGQASVQSADCVSKEILHTLVRGLAMDTQTLATLCVIEVHPVGDFITYGVGVSLMTMRHPDQARGRAPVAATS